MELNATQQDIVQSVRGPIMVVAGPGSGKTAVITARAAHLCQIPEIEPQQLLIMTFTKAAANEMLRRLKDLVGQQAAAMHIRTIHGFAYQLLQHVRGRVTLVDEGQQRQVMRQVLRRHALSDEFLEPCMQELSNCVNRGHVWRSYAPRTVDADVFRTVVASYEEWKANAGRLDFDDLLDQAAAVLEQMPQRPGRFLMVDEFQDTSILQYRIVRRLAAADNNLFVVGDDDQSIYGWRGASQVMAAFQADYPKAQRFSLTTNFRCSAAIVGVTSSLIKNNEHRLPKDLQAASGDSRAPLPTFYQPEDERDEARWSVQVLQNLAKEGIPWKEMAVIYRTNRQALLFKQQLEKVHIPFRTLGGDWDVLSHWVALDLLSYLRAASDPQDTTSFFRILNRPGRYFSRAMVEQAQRDAQDHALAPAAALRYRSLPGHLAKELAALQNHLAMMTAMPAAKALRWVRHKMGYDDHVISTCQQLRLDGDVALDAAHILTQLPEDDEGIPEFLQRMSATQQGMRSSVKDNGVTLTTSHSAKGLEFTAVVVAGLVEDVFPHEKAIMGNSWSDLEEERRLLYVAATRARTHLFFSSPRSVRSQKADYSRFVDELRAGLPRRVRTTGDVVEHPAWGRCRIAKASGSTVVLHTPEGTERVVLKSWLEEHLLLAVE